MTAAASSPAASPSAAPVPSVGPPTSDIVLERCASISDRFERWTEMNVNPFHKSYEEMHGGRMVMDGNVKLMTGSSSYLGLSNDHRLKKAAVAALDRYGSACHGSRALSGSKAIHAEFEREIAAFVDAPAAAVFANGWLTNYTTIATLFGPGDTVITDLKNHNCIAAGIQASGANVVYYRADDPRTLKRALGKAKGDAILVVADAVFSMDGDVLPLPDVAELCQRHRAMLMIDEAQSIGVVGATGRGLVEHFDLDPSLVDIRTGTMSKVLSSSGGFVLADDRIVTALTQGADGFLFTGAVPVTAVAIAMAALRILETEPERVRQLQERCEHFRHRLLAAGLPVIGRGTAIIPVVYRSESIMFDVVRRMDERGIYVLPAVYPAVPKKSPRVRFNVTNDLSFDDLDLIADVFIEVNRKVLGEGVLDLTDPIAGQ